MNLRIKSTFKTIISVEFSFLAVIALLGLSESSACIYMSLASCILHETGHLLAMFFFGVGVKKIVLYGAGIKIVRDFSLVENKKEAVILLSGPLMNILAFAVFYMFDGENFKVFAVMNLATALFNILPIKALDGGQLLLLIFDSKPKLLSFINIITCIITPALVLAVALMMSFFKINLSLLISGAYFFIFSLIDNFSAISTKNIRVL
ncbi:MAG: site-2 protease family protein [Oscillospiraceae bacterium]